MEVMARLLAAGSFSQTVAGSTTKLCFLGFLSDGDGAYVLFVKSYYYYTCFALFNIVLILNSWEIDF
jgi:hypothetical protein